jgi:multidrug resistance efflux pump
VVLAIYMVWMAGPYLRSVVARDAAVTSWITVAHSPIAGRVTAPLLAGTQVAADGLIATVINDRADPMPLARAEADRARAAAERDGLANEVVALEALLADRQRAADVFAETFRRDLIDEIDAIRAPAWHPSNLRCSTSGPRRSGRSA